MVGIPPDERLVYLALKNVFQGDTAKMRNLKPIRKQIDKHCNEQEVQALLAEHSIEIVCNTVKALLEDQVFESTLKAKIRFPEVFEVSPAQSAEREMSEAEAARHEADAIKDAALGHQMLTTPHTLDESGKCQKGKAKQSDLPINAVAFQKRSFPHATIAVPSLYPSYLPLKTQHRLLTKVQAILEHACYTFAQNIMDEELDSNGWDSAECVELNIWAQLFRRCPDRFDADRLNELGKPFSETLGHIQELRHTAVHRLKVSSNKLEQFMVTADYFSDLLGNQADKREITRLRRHTKLISDELGRNKDLLEAKLNAQLEKIAEKRLELDSQERRAIAGMLRDDKEYQILAAESLEEMIDTPITVLHSAATSEQETSSETDLDGEIISERAFFQSGEEASCSKSTRKSW